QSKSATTGKSCTTLRAARGAINEARDTNSNRLSGEKRHTMRIATVGIDRGHRAARVEGDELVLLDAPDIGALLAEPDWQQIARGGRDRHSAAEAQFAPVVPRPEKIICVGLNYRSHAEETGLDVPDHPAIFAKYSRALIG